MALGKPNHSDAKAVSLKLKLKEGANFLDVPYFEITEKQGDKYVPVGKERDVDGALVGLTTRKGEYEGSPIYNAKLELLDQRVGEKYYVEFGLGSSVGRNLANSILNVSDFGSIKIGLYGQTNKVTGKTYPAASLRQGFDEEIVRWKFDPKETDELKPIEVTFKGKLVKDYSKAEEFLFDKLAEFGKTIKRPEAAAQSAPVAAPKEKDDEVPF